MGSIILSDNKIYHNKYLGRKHQQFAIISPTPDHSDHPYLRIYYNFYKLLGSAP